MIAMKRIVSLAAPGGGGSRSAGAPVVAAMAAAARAQPMLMTGRSSSSFFSTSSSTSTTAAAANGNAAAPPPAAVAAAEQPIRLNEVPSLPLFGSLIKAHSGIAPIDLDDPIKWWRNMHNKHGPFYSVGIPGIGSGSRGTIYMIRDVKEMMRVIKQEGAYPSGLVEKQWPLKAWMEGKNKPTSAILTRGAEWKRLRTFMQKDLLSPSDAKQYLPGILKAASQASQRAANFAEVGDLVKFLNFCALDLFTEVLLAGRGDMSDDDYSKFCHAAVDGLSITNELMLSPLETVAHQVGFKTSRMKRYLADFDLMDDIAHRRFHEFLARYEKDALTDEEKNTYFYKLVKRQPESDVTLQETMDIAVIMMIAAVDTTAAKTSWSLLQLVLHPEIQDQLYEQLDRVAQEEGRLSESLLDRSRVPLLHAVVREAYRCTPPVAVDIVKNVDTPTEIHGTQLPAGSSIAFDSQTYQMDPNLVEDPMSFQPARWLKDAVDGRKGTPSAIIDHPFYAGPFSQGARRCPGSRVANLEEHAMLAQFVLDWKMTCPTQPDLHWNDVPGKLHLMFVPQFPDIAFEKRTSA